MAEYLFLTVGIVGGACLDVVQTVHQVSVVVSSSQLAYLQCCGSGTF
jgi:hypothetical protein